MVSSSGFRLLSKADAAAVFGVCLKTIDNYIESGLLPRPVQFASKAYWHPEEFQSFIDKTFRTTAPATAEEPAQPVTDRKADGAVPSTCPEPQFPRDRHPAARARARVAATLKRLNADT